MPWREHIHWHPSKKKDTADPDEFPDHSSSFLPRYREMNKMFHDFFTDFGRMPAFHFRKERLLHSFSPNVNVSDNENELEITAEIPGMNYEELNVSLQVDNLLIEGEKRHELEEKEKDYYHFERSFGKFKRSIPIPCKVEEDQVKATFKNGVLKIILPKCKDNIENLKKIEIEPLE